MLIALCINAKFKVKLNTHQICRHGVRLVVLTHSLFKDQSNLVIKVKGAFINTTSNLRMEKKEGMAAYTVSLQCGFCFNILSDLYLIPPQEKYYFMFRPP